jgi:hypothetical protein
MVRLDAVDAKIDKWMRNYGAPIPVKVYVPGHNHDAQIADVDFRITQLSPEGLTRAEYLEKLQTLWDEKEAYENMEDVADEWKYDSERDGNGNVVTYASKWEASDFAGKRAILKDVKLQAGKNDEGEIYIIAEIVDAFGHTTLHTIGDPSGKSLMERAKAKGIMPESHADEFDEI